MKAEARSMVEVSNAQNRALQAALLHLFICLGLHLIATRLGRATHFHCVAAFRLRIRRLCAQMNCQLQIIPICIQHIPTNSVRRALTRSSHEDYAARRSTCGQWQLQLPRPIPTEMPACAIRSTQGICAIATIALMRSHLGWVQPHD